MDELKKRIEIALRRACAPDAQPSIELDTIADRIGGKVVSERFEDLTPAQRQDLIWDQLDEALTRDERARISFIITDTPEEYEQLLRDAR